MARTAAPASGSRPALPFLPLPDPLRTHYPEKAGHGFTSLSSPLGPVRSGHQGVPEFDRLGRARAGLADRDDAVLGQRHLLVVQGDLPAVGEGHVGAVAAVVAQDEIALAGLDRAVLARGGEG